MGDKLNKFYKNKINSIKIECLINPGVVVVTIALEAVNLHSQL